MTTESIVLPIDTPGPRAVASDLDRFRSKVDTSGGLTACHEWQGGRSRHGYGQFRPRGGPPTYAHRWILGHLRGAPLTRSEWSLHHCDNPPCVNPRHLYIGDQRQNMADARDRGRLNLTGLVLGRASGKTLGMYRTGPELCGTPNGYARHRRRRELTCGPCREAVNEYNRQRVADRAAN